MAESFHFPRYKRLRSEGPIDNLPRDRAAESYDGEMPAEGLSDLLGRVSESSTTQIDNLVGDFGRLREKLRVDAERIQREIEEYKALSEQVMQLTRTVSESVEKVRASVGQ